MTHSSKDYVEESVLNPASILVDIVATPFSVKRRSNPSAAFAEMMDRFSAATREDDEMARAFASLQKRFKGVVLERQDAVRLADLEARGAGNLGIRVGSLPLAMGPGLAYMYAAALETLRSTDLPIEPELIGARAIRMLERSLDSALPFVGSMSVTALELALDDERFSDQLRDRAFELGGVVELDQPPVFGCEFCVFQIEEPDGTVTSTCGTEDQCKAAGGLFLILLALLLLGGLWDWLS